MAAVTPPLTLYLIRHPRPLIAPGVCYGRLDVAAEDPTPIAAALREKLPGSAPVWTSPLQRCRHLAEQLHPQPRQDSRLQEIDFGGWEGRAWDDVPRPELDAWAADLLNYAPPDGESPARLAARVDAFVAELPPGEHILVTHAGVIRVLQSRAEQLPLAAGLRRPAVVYGSLLRITISRAEGSSE